LGTKNGRKTCLIPKNIDFATSDGRCRKARSLFSATPVTCTSGRGKLKGLDFEKSKLTRGTMMVHYDYGRWGGFGGELEGKSSSMVPPLASFLAIIPEAADLKASLMQRDVRKPHILDTHTALAWIASRSSAEPLSSKFLTRVAVWADACK